MAAIWVSERLGRGSMPAIFQMSSRRTTISVGWPA